jgi:uncharacterized protein YcfL
VAPALQDASEEERLNQTSCVSASAAVAALSVMVAAGLWSTGCGANTYTSSMQSSNVELRRVIRDSSLASDIQVEAANVVDRAGRKVAQVAVRNAGGATRTIEVKFRWLDGSGIDPTPNLSTWRAFTLGPGEVVDVSSLGGESGVDFSVTIRNKA